MNMAGATRLQAEATTPEVCDCVSPRQNIPLFIGICQTEYPPLPVGGQLVRQNIWMEGTQSVVSWTLLCDQVTVVSDVVPYSTLRSDGRQILRGDDKGEC